MELIRSILKLGICIASLPYLAAAETERVVKIGILTDLTGKAAYHGQQTRVAAQLIEQEFAAEGKQIKLVLGDHGLDTARAVTEVQKLVVVDDVDAVFSNFSGTSRAASPIVRNAGKLFVYTAAAAEPLKDNPLSFKSYLDYVAGCRKLAEQWKVRGIKVVGVLKAEAEFGELCLQGVTQSYPDAVVVDYKLGDELASQLLILKTKGVEAIVNAGYEGDMRTMLKGMRQLRYKAIVGSNEDIFTDKLISEFPEELSRAFAFGMPRPQAEFVAKLKAMDSKNLTGSLEQAGMSYLHLKQLYAAIAACPVGAAECQRTKLFASPSAPEFGFQGWSGSRQANYVWTVSHFENGKFVPIAK